MSKQIRLGIQMLTLLLLALLIFAACGGGAPAPAEPAKEEPAKEEPAAAEPAKEEPAAAEEEEAAEEPAAEEPAAAGEREIVWMVRTGPVENKWEQEVVAPAWEKENPDVKLNLLIIDQPDIAVKREAVIAAGEPLHVWSTNWGGDGFASDRSRGLLTDLTPLIEKDNLDLSVFIPEVLEIYQSDGKVWGLPFLTTGSYVFYNMKLFDEAGLEYPTTDWEDKSWTWDKMLELAKQLTKNYDDPTSAQY